MGVAKAKESREVKKARDHLKKQIKKEKKQFTHKALSEVSKKILGWLGRHEEERIKIKLKGKEISLFDENKHSAKPGNHHIQTLQKHLKASATHSSPNIKGRFKKVPSKS